MSRIINYCSGGLGNRLKPFSSCGVISQLTGRKLGVLWKPTMRCQTDFHDLFTNDVELFDSDSLGALNSVEIYSERPYIVHDANLNNMRGLLKLSGQYNVRSLPDTPHITKADIENVIVYSNDYLAGYSKEHTTSFLKTLDPLDFIKEEISKFCLDNGIGKSIIGVHVRGTDFENGGSVLPSIISQMEQFNGRFFVCSDSLEYETALQQRFGDRVIFRRKCSYVYKENSSAGWTNNVQTPKESVQESLIDLYILSMTDFRIYNPNSTFAHIALDLSLS
jgi:hypothetical protein